LKTLEWKMYVNVFLLARNLHYIDRFYLRGD